MIFAFVEGGSLKIHESQADAVRQWEGVDVESGAVAFYDETGVYLEPRFTKPNRGGKLLGFLGWVQSGTYELVPNPTADEDPFALALYETQLLEPNPWFSTLADLKTALSRKGVKVEFDAKEI